MAKDDNKDVKTTTESSVPGGFGLPSLHRATDEKTGESEVAWTEEKAVEKLEKSQSKK
jgi:hypothetical protein